MKTLLNTPCGVDEWATREPGRYDRHNRIRLAVANAVEEDVSERLGGMARIFGSAASKPTPQAIGIFESGL